jgi:hypothetical protein
MNTTYTQQFIPRAGVVRDLCFYKLFTILCTTLYASYEHDVHTLTN